MMARIESMVAATIAAYGRLDCAFNNAGLTGSQVGAEIEAGETYYVARINTGDGNGGNIYINDPIDGPLNPGSGTYSSKAPLSFVAEQDIHINASIWNTYSGPEQTGNVNIIAGWNAVPGAPDSGIPGLSKTFTYNFRPPGTEGFNLNDVLADPANYGNRNGWVYIGGDSNMADRTTPFGNQTAPIVIGSYRGDVNIMGYGMTMAASDATANAFTQVGYRPTTAGENADGLITLNLKEGGLTVDAGNATGSYSQIGHGGLNSGAGNHSGRITVRTDRGAGVGNIALTGGNATDAYVQLGHGGANVVGNMGGIGADGDIIAIANKRNIGTSQAH